MLTSINEDLGKQLDFLLLTRGIGCLLGAVILLLTARHASLPVNAVYMSSDSLLSIKQTVFVPAIRSLFDLNISIIASITLGITGMISLYRYSKYGNQAYSRAIKREVNSLKWLDQAIGLGPILALVAVVAGSSDILALKVIVIALALSSYLGWLTEKQNAKSKKSDYSAFIGSCLSLILPLVFIGGSLIFSWLYGVVRLPWYGYTLPGAITIGLAMLLVNQYLGIINWQAWKQYKFTERNYLLIDMATKLAFVVIVAIGLKG